MVAQTALSHRLVAMVGPARGVVMLRRCRVGRRLMELRRMVVDKVGRGVTGAWC